MALTIGEASDVNTLLEHVLNLSNPTGRVPNSEQAMEAAARLADKATKALLAGLDGDRVRAAWPDDEYACAYGCGFTSSDDSDMAVHYRGCEGKAS